MEFMMKIREVTSTKEFNALKDKWTELLKKSSNDNIFLTHEWLNTWWKYFGEGKELKIILVEENDKLVGIAPLMLTKRLFFLRRLQFIGSPHSDYHDFILLSGREDRILVAILDYLLGQPFKWDVLDLKGIPQYSETLKIIDDCSYQTQKTIQDICPVLKLPKCWDDLLNQLGERRNIKRYSQRLNKQYQVNYESCENKDLLETYMKMFFALHQRRWTKKGSKGVFADPQIKKFAIDIAKLFYDKDWLQLRVLKVNGKPISIYYIFKYNNIFYYYLSGTDPNWSKYRVGTLLLADCIRSAIQKGCTEFDFTRGAEDYKKLWNTQNRYNIRLELVNDRLSSEIKYKLLLYLRLVPFKNINSLQVK